VHSRSMRKRSAGKSAFLATTRMRWSGSNSHEAQKCSTSIPSPGSTSGARARCASSDRSR
jgi:hypothetical protein